MLAMLAIALLAHMPIVGKLVWLAALITGIGVIVGAIVHRSSATTTPGTPPPTPAT
jgi:hypothetical protein